MNTMRYELAFDSITNWTNSAQRHTFTFDDGFVAIFRGNTSWPFDFVEVYQKEMKRSCSLYR